MSARSKVNLAAALAGMLLTCNPCAFALNPALDVSQYAHTSWKVRDGFTKGQITSVAQTPDGYLWLGTEFGLLRFDGVRNVAWRPPPGQELPSNYIVKLLAARDGTLWIGTIKGLANWKDGKLTQYPDFVGQIIGSLLEDRDRSIWVSAMQGPIGRLCVFRNSGVRCYGKEDGIGYAVWGLYEDTAGNVWSGGDAGIWHWKPGAPKLYSLPHQPNGIQALAERDDGGLLVSMVGGIRRFVDGKTQIAYPFPAPLEKFEAHRLLRDHDGGYGSERPAEASCMYTRERRTCLPTRTDSPVTILPGFLRIANTISGLRRPAVSTVSGALPSPRFPLSRVCRTPRSRLC